MNDIIPFQSLDLPSDIQIVSAPDFPYYVFHKMNPSYYFRIFIEEIIDNQQNVSKTILRAFKCDKNGKTDKNKDSEIIPQSQQMNMILNVNTFIWTLSDIPYSHRFIKKEIIERLRGITTNDKLIEINELIIKTTKSHKLSNTDDDDE
jgi:hypothetical protein